MEIVHSLLLSHDAKCRHVNLLEYKTEKNPVAYSEPCQTSKMDPVWQDSKYTSVALKKQVWLDAQRHLENLISARFGPVRP